MLGGYVVDATFSFLYDRQACGQILTPMVPEREQRPVQGDDLSSIEAANDGTVSLGKWLDCTFNGEPRERAVVALGVATTSLFLLDLGLPSTLASVPFVMGSAEVARNISRSVFRKAKS